ncbi:MAG: Crp/Fnr family transcriptional regulator [Bacteroidetes bacterium]|nr:Crp/Fnr family transcriptional regulator [Bacteroidota bacterium]MCH8524677.1 Crp/Fnr family transcriptional regulator [Balneolales bacterium]
MHRIKRNTILLSQGEICRYTFKVVTGCFKSYVIDSSGKEHILQFAPEDWYISDLDSLVNEKPSVLFIEAIEDTTYIRLTKEELQSFSKDEQNRKLVNSVISLQNRLVALLSSTAEERYFDFINAYPSMINRLPLKLIASYIGVTPEYLSEIRRKLKEK